MALDLEGKLKMKLPAQGGTSARGAWTRQDFVLEFQDGNYPTEACFSAWGQDKVYELSRFQPGDAIRVSFNVKAREYAGRWYNDLRVWRILPSGAQASSPMPQSAQAYQAPQPEYSAPAPTLDDMPADSGISEDDLPF